MLIVVIMGKWSDDSAWWVVHDVRLYSLLDTVVISGEDVCCSVAFGTLVGVFVFSVMWSGLLMASAIICPVWLSVYECQRVECAFTYPVKTECGMFVMYWMSVVCSAWMCCLEEVYKCLQLWYISCC